MDTTEQIFPWLELIDYPAFCVKDGVVAGINLAAKSRMICVGTDIHDIVTNNLDTYENFSGCLFLTVSVGGIPCKANVNRTKDCDVFILEQDSDEKQLQTLALAAQQLRMPLSNVMIVADRLLEQLDSQQAGQLQHGLFQLLRIISNMSDSGNYRENTFSNMEMTNITGLFREIMEKAQTISESTGITLAYTEPKELILSLANPEKLERAVYNILSNALKFSPAGSTVEAKLSLRGNQISFTICNPCTEPVQEYAFWNRYRREPALEDNRHGLGLGMTLVGSVAAAHGGTVLIDHPDSQSTRLTMTIALRTDSGTATRSPILRIGDYSGGRDKALLEFADLLPTNAYENI